MSFATTLPHRSDPATTTTTTNTTTTTVTTTTVTTALSGPQTAYATPSLESRPVGWHAGQFKYDWNKPADHHKYQSTTGLPALHAAVINNDWEFATAALCPGDIGMLWLPPASQRPEQAKNTYFAPSTWASNLPSVDPEKQKRAILEMATERVEKTNIKGLGSLYGCNLLTLCLELPAPADFTEKLIQLSAEHSPQYLNLTDAKGCTPLYIAACRGDAKQAAMLIAAGANPQTPCVFQLANNESSVASAYSQALKSKDIAILEIFLEKILSSVDWKNGYPINDDPLELERWCLSQDEENIQKLANKFDVIKNPLLNFDDKTGSSIVYRTLKNRQPLSTGITPLYRGDPETGAIFAAAVSGNLSIFTKGINNFPSCYNDSYFFGASQKEVRMNYLLKNHSLDYIEILFEESNFIVEGLNESDFENEFILSELIKHFLQNNSADNIQNFLKECPKAAHRFKEIINSNFLFEQCAFENFSAAMEAAWPVLDKLEKWTILLKSFSTSSMHTAFITNLPGSTAMINSSPDNLDFGDRMVLTSMQKLLNARGDEVLPVMADLNPSLLMTWLQGLHFGVTQQMIDQARTTEGKAILADLMQAQARSVLSDM